MNFVLKFFSFISIAMALLVVPSVRKNTYGRIGPFFARWFRLAAVLHNPMKLWQSPPNAYPALAVPLLWKWAERQPLRFNPRHAEGPRSQQNYNVFYHHISSISDWVFYAASKDSTWLLAWWPKWLMETTVLRHVVCSTLWERGAVFLWDNTEEKSANALFGSAVGSHPDFAAFLKSHPHEGLSRLAIEPSHAWTPEMLLWMLEGHTDRMASWVREHACNPRAAWDYLGDLTQPAMSQNYIGGWNEVYSFEMELWEAQRFDTLFPLQDGWTWAKVFALYGVDTLGLAASVRNWHQEDASTIQAGHICHRQGHRVAPRVLGEPIAWELSLLLGHPEWLEWSPQQRIAAILGPKEVQESLPIDGLL